jgi:drug/metabolite transporter (DMT)-like permease
MLEWNIDRLGPPITILAKHTEQEYLNTYGRSLLLTALAMLAFAGNSLLCRMALRGHEIDPASFTSIRLASGAIMLCLICARRVGALGSHGSWLSACALFGYAAAFSYSYVTLPTAVGALILFGCVQGTMISYGLWRGERLSATQVAGLVIALGGLGALCAPGLTQPSLAGAMLMLVAGISWGVYSLRGRNLAEPTLVTAGNFLRAAPIALLVSCVTLQNAALSASGALFAVLSGAFASAVGYAIWYSALRNLPAFIAATVQLSVPVIAALGAVGMLGEAFTARLVACSVAILGGIGLITLAKVRR